MPVQCRAIWGELALFIRFGRIQKWQHQNRCAKTQPFGYSQYSRAQKQGGQMGQAVTREMKLVEPDAAEAQPVRLLRKGYQRGVVAQTVTGETCKVDADRRICGHVTPSVRTTGAEASRPMVSAARSRAAPVIAAKGSR